MTEHIKKKLTAEIENLERELNHELPKELKKAVGARVSDVMTTDPETVTVDATVEDIATLMVEKDVSRVPVVEGVALVGIVSKYDIVRSIANEE